jgi:hypothetical protein
MKASIKIDVPAWGDEPPQPAVPAVTGHIQKAVETLRRSKVPATDAARREHVHGNQATTATGSKSSKRWKRRRERQAAFVSAEEAAPKPSQDSSVDAPAAEAIARVYVGGKRKRSRNIERRDPKGAAPDAPLRTEERDAAKKMEPSHRGRRKRPKATDPVAQAEVLASSQPDSTLPKQTGPPNSAHLKKHQPADALPEANAMIGDPDLAEVHQIKPEYDAQLQKAVLLQRRKHISRQQPVGAANQRPGDAGASHKGRGLRESMLQKLSGARFRYLNEMLYTSESPEAFEKFQSDPKLFDVYHEGFRSQVAKWPSNPGRSCAL